MFRLPSLQSLKIFECVARHTSFTKAANELDVSQGAISQHIKNLEARVGFSVFTREGRRVSLTQSGDRLLASVINSLSNIQQTIELEQRKLRSNELTLSVLPGFAIRWLFPRLMAFNERYPDIKISVNAVANPLDFSLFHAHAAVDYGPASERVNEKEALFKEQLFPVCSAQFIEQHALSLPLNKQQALQLLSLPLLGDESPTPSAYTNTWDYWVTQTYDQTHLLEEERHSLDKGIIKKHSQSNITLQLAELGHGIAMGRTSLVMDSLTKGDLIALTDFKIANPCCYFIKYNPSLAANHSLNLFIEWLKEESLEIESFTNIS